MKTIAYQGIEGSFSHLTAKRLYGNSCRLLGLPTFREAFEAVENGAADLALLPIENTLAGTIYETLDLLSQGDLKIIGVVNTRIEHSLLGMAGASISEIRKVLSHPKALAQCIRFLSEHPQMEAVPHYDTAGAAADVAKTKDPTIAAIANSIAAEIYGLELIAHGIQDHSENFTRFFLLSKQSVEGKKCSLCFTLEHKAGSLAEILAFLARHGVNLTYIVSRPLIGSPFEYIFYVDLETPSPLVIEELSKKTKSLKILGTYTEVSSRIGIIGLGLIGGSIQKALQEKRVLVIEKDLLERLDEIDVLILAVPISAILEIGEKISRKNLSRPLVILDVGSVKEVIASRFEKWTNHSIEFVATHPMAGKDQSGFENSDPQLFHNAPWVITPHAKNTESVLQKVEEIIRLLEAHPLRMEAKIHDERAALISHVPYILSKSLLQFVSQEDPESLKMAGPGFKSMTRLGHDNPNLHAEIGIYNKKNIKAILKKWIEFLEQTE